MPWSLYKDWGGNVVGARIRVPAHALSGAACFGPSMNSLHLRPGATGVLESVLPEGARLPAYVKFPGKLDLHWAAEVRFRRIDNTPVMWADFRTTQMYGDEAVVVITYPVLGRLEIEHP